MDIATMQESFVRGIDAVLRPYFIGGSHSLQGTSLAIPAANLLYDLRLLEPNPSVPTIVFHGNSILSHERLKVQVTRGEEKVVGYEVRAQVSKNVYVQTGISSGNSPDANNLRFVDRLYGFLVAACLVNDAKFNEQHIFDLTISPLPFQIPDKTYAIVQGQMTCNVRCAFFPEPVS